jgi:hypothetical protein
MRKLRLSIGSCGNKLSCAKNTTDSPKTPISPQVVRTSIRDIDCYKQTFNEHPPEQFQTAFDKTLVDSG